MQGKDEIEAQTWLSLFNKAIMAIEKQIKERFKDNQDLLKSLELIKENNTLIESALNESKDNEHIQHLAQAGKEIADDLEKKIKEHNRNIAALLITDFNKIKNYYIAYLPKENPTGGLNNNPSQSMSHFSAGGNITANQVYNAHRAPTNIFYQSAVTYGTQSPAYSVPSPPLGNTPRVENIPSAVRNSDYLKSDKGAIMDNPQEVRERQQLQQMALENERKQKQGQDVLSVSFMRNGLFITDIKKLPLELQPIIKAILTLDENAVKAEIRKNNHIVHKTDQNGNLPIHYAAYKGSMTLLEIFKEARSGIGAKNQKFNLNLLHIASFFGYTQASAWLQSVGTTAESVDIYETKLKVTNKKFLVDKLTCTPFQLAVLNGQIGVTKFFLSNLKNKGELEVSGIGNILHLAVFSRDPWLLKELLINPIILQEIEHNTNFLNNTDNRLKLTPLMLAARIGNLAAVSLLTAHRDIQIQRQSERQGRTALHHAAKTPNPDIVDALIGNIGSAKAAVELCQIPDWTDGIFTAVQIANRKYNKYLGLFKQNHKSGDEKLSYEYLSVVNTFKDFHAENWENVRNKINYKRPRVRNLVLQGGGPKGIVYIGAFAALAEKLGKGGWDINALERIGGTSAGAITAAALALNFNPNEIDRELGDLNLGTLLDGINADKLVQAIKLVKTTFAKENLGKSEVASLVLEVTRLMGNFNYKATAGYYLYSHYEELWEKFKAFTGLCSGDTFLHWFEDLLKRKLKADKVDEMYDEEFINNFTLENLAKLIAEQPGLNYKHFYAVTTCITGEPHSIVISSEFDKDKSFERFRKIKVSHVVRASMSIPAVFKPFELTYVENGKAVTIQCLDGGMLLNFPIKLFDKVKYMSRYLKGDGEYEVFNEETLGFRLVNPEKQELPEQPEKIEKIEDVLGFMSKVINLFYNAEANLANVENAYQYRCIPISNCGVGTLDFNLTDEKKKAMKDVGYKTISKFFEDFEKISGVEPSGPPPRTEGYSQHGTFPAPKAPPTEQDDKKPATGASKPGFIKGQN